jgi:hypothetical protein
MLPLPLLTTSPSRLTLSDSSTCPCQSPRITFDPQRPKEIRQCNVYGLVDARSVEIEVQKCPACPHGYIGPECTDLGLFNLNNRTVFTLTVLDDYTCSFSRSETPFVSWVNTTACRYQNHHSSIPFIKEKAFRAVWFSYIRLVRFDNDMQCPRCGPSPKVTIWDGVTLAFAKKNLLPTIHPPTRTDGQSDIKDGIRPLHGLQILVEKPLRKLIHTILTGPTLVLPNSSGDEPQTPKTSTREDMEMLDRIEKIPDVISKLAELSPHMAVLFDRWFGITRLSAGLSPPKEYRDLYLQVSRDESMASVSNPIQMSAEENALQFINETAIVNVRAFLANPIKKNMPYLVHCPAFYKVAKREFDNTQGSMNETTLAVFTWVYVRAFVVLGELSQHASPASNAMPDQEIVDWRKVWACSNCDYPISLIDSDRSLLWGATDSQATNLPKYTHG